MQPYFTSISLTGLKGKTGKFALQPITLVTGPIMSGKTRILDGLTLAHIGYLPQLGRKPGSTRQLARAGKEMSVIAVRSDKQMVVQTWSAKNVYTVKPEDHQFAPAAMLDLSEFWGMTGPARTSYLLDRCGMGKADAEQVFSLLLQALDQADLPDGLDQKPVREQLNQVFAEVRLLTELPPSTPAVLQAVADAVGLKLKTARSNAKTLRGSINQLEVNAAAEGLDASIDHSAELVQAQQAQQRAAEALATKEALGKAAQRENQPVLKALADLVKEGVMLKQATECPVCHASGSGWKDSHLSTLRTKHAELLACSKEIAGRVPSDTEVQPLRDELVQAQQVVTQLEQRQKLWHAHKGKDKTLAEIAAQAEAADDLAVALAAASTLVRAEVSRVTSESVKTIVDRANHLVTPVLDLVLAYEDGQFGYWREQQWVALDTMSGSERLLAFGGLQLAFTHDCPTRLLLMDELGRVDVLHKRRLIDVLATLIQRGVIHQFVGVDLQADWFTSLVGLTGENFSFVKDNSTLINIK